MKLRLLIFASLFSVSGFSQTISSFNSDPNTDFTISTPGSTVDQTPTGANAVWTFMNLFPSGNNIDSYAAPDATQLNTYPGTTQVLTVTSQGSMPVTSEFFQRIDGSGTYITGVAQGDIILNYNTTNAFIGSFPLNFNDSNTTNVAGTFTYQGTSGTFTGTVTATVDAYGTLTILEPLTVDYVAPVTRLRIDQNLSFSIPPIFNNIGTLTQTTYYYYDNSADNISFRYNNAQIVSGFLGINEATETFERNTALTLSRNTVNTSNVQVYPNPAKDMITITGTHEQLVKSVSITDMQGRTVLTSPVINSSISVSNLRQGLYFMTLETDSGAVAKKKFIKK